MHRKPPDKISTYRPINDLIPSDWRTNNLTLSDGGTLHYLHTANNQPPVIMIHGIQVDGRMWTRTALALQHDYTCIMPDIRGHGLSSPMPTDLTPDTLSDDLVELVDALNLSEPPILIGHSMGADIVLRLATKIEARQLILVDPALKNFLPPIGDELPAYMTPIINTINRLSDLPHIERMKAGYSLVIPGAPLWQETDYVTFIEGQSRFDVNSYKGMSKMGYVVEQPDIIKQVDCPLLLLTAKPMLPPDDFHAGVAIFMDNAQQGQHTHFEDSGHAIMFDQFERFIKTVRATI